MRQNIAATLIGVLALGGALLARGPRSLSITIHSDPEGATLYANHDEQRMGYTPFTMKYKPSNEFKAGRACFTVQPIKVRWASGVEASLDDFSACPDKGAQQQFTFVRPDVAGRETDVQFALEMEKIAAMRSSAPPPSIPVYVPPAQTHCTSTLIGTQVFTNCY